ncbi:hypothetical protein DPMN_137797 [Dreissena polymorpha]|uniref:PX domain-containing protein n=1 Tax=Dreissena polymorpha TaxID=45954 RepID=A0A9D4G650_DREPO|nr:hypothetical protein DPMN_137797 [Dreissena polymorpha]
MQFQPPRSDLTGTSIAGSNPCHHKQPRDDSPSKETSEVEDVDFHIFASNIIFSRFKDFSWLQKVLSAHIYHPYQAEMRQPSEVFQLPIILKNEAKHEDCIDILDQYQQVLGDVYMKAFVRIQAPLTFFEEAKHLRSFATSPEKRFEDLHPFIIELWHIKQDFLEVLINLVAVKLFSLPEYKVLMKCFKKLFSSKTLRQTGTLYHYKGKLQRSDVNGKVKGAFKAHHDFLSLAGKQMVKEQLMEFFGMESPDSSCTRFSW